MTLPARAEPLASPLEGLPLCDPSEIERATGFVRTVRSLVTVPLTTLGLLATLGVPPEGLGVILGIDRLLDMARAVPNVVGDLGAATFVARYAGTEPGSDELADPSGSGQR